MKHLLVSPMVLMVAVSVFLVGCTQSAPAPTPTKTAAAPAQAPTAAAKPAEPTKAAVAAPTAAPVAPTAAPTAAPAKKVDFPQSGRSITYIVPFAPGGGNDVVARLLAPYMEKELKVPVQVVNKAGGDTQVAMTELVRSKPDGYTLGTVDIFACIGTYLQPERQAIYTRKDFQPIRMLNSLQATWLVKADSPYKSVKDLVDAAKAKPGDIKVGDTGLMGPYHLANLLFEKQYGIKLTLVHFEGGGPASTALLGGHVDAIIIGIAGANTSLKSGGARILGIMDKQRSKFYPDAKTFEEQGYKTYMLTYYAAAGAAGTPREIVDALGDSIKKAQASDDFLKKADELSLTIIPNMGPAEAETYWAEEEKSVKEMLDLAKAEAQTK